MPNNQIYIVYFCVDMEIKVYITIIIDLVENQCEI